VFEDPSLAGPQNVHSLGDGYPASSVFGLDADWPEAAGYGRVEVTDADDADVWSWHLFGGPLAQVPVPDLPAARGWAGIPASIEILTTASVADADLNDMAFDDFPSLVETTVDAVILSAE
jgi:hypothetical protein